MTGVVAARYQQHVQANKGCPWHVAGMSTRALQKTHVPKKIPLAACILDSTILYLPCASNAPEAQRSRRLEHVTLCRRRPACSSKPLGAPTATLKSKRHPRGEPLVALLRLLRCQLGLPLFCGQFLHPSRMVEAARRGSAAPWRPVQE